MRSTLLAVLVLVAACGKSAPSAPKIDPSVLLVNHTDDAVRLIWATDAGVDTVVIPPRTTHCEKWLQAFDSLYVKIIDSVSTNYPGYWVQTTLPWLHFADYPYYFQVDTVFFSGSALGIAQHITDSECQ